MHYAVATILTGGIVASFTTSFAKDVSYHLASANAEMAGAVAEYNIDIGSAIGVFDIFSGSDSESEERISQEDDLAEKLERDIELAHNRAIEEHESAVDDISYEEDSAERLQRLLKPGINARNEEEYNSQHRIETPGGFYGFFFHGLTEENSENATSQDVASEEENAIEERSAKTAPPKPEAKPDEEALAESTIIRTGPILIENPPVPAPNPFRISDKSLDKKNAGIYKKIFSLQAAGKMKEADKEIMKLTDMRLRGHMLYQRYMHPTSYVTNFDELRNWLAIYSELPGAKRVYELAVRKMPSGFSGNIVRPQQVRTIVRKREPNIYHGLTYVSSRKRSAAQQKQIQDIADKISHMVRRDRFTNAYTELSKPEMAKNLDTVEFDNLRARIAEGYLHEGHMSNALRLASASADRSGEYAPLAGWIAGLVSWGNGDYAKAADYFALPARSKYASSWTQSAGAFWAARANMRAGNTAMARAWLTEAMKHPRTFYGLVATRAMGRNINFNWDFPNFTNTHKVLLESTPEGKRASDLVAAGQLHIAEAELLQLNPQTSDMQEALLAYAGHAGLPALALRAGSAFEGPGGVYYDAALYPTGNWQPRENYKIDPELVHAIMRQESKFDTRAESRSGALGLMQIMPSTASFISGKRSMKSRAGQEQLLDPHTNIELGQQYLEFLLNNKHVDGDMISTLIAYNAGPGNLRRWKKRWDGITDPLLFIELIPARETRAYVERVLSNYWIYRQRAGLQTPTLDALAKGRNAYYADAQKAMGGASLFRVAQTPAQ